MKVRRTLKLDKRLLGTWRSDRRLTVAEWRSKRRLTPKLRKHIADMFGHLTLRFTLTRLYSEFKGNRHVVEYKVLASDSESVAVLYRDCFPKGPRIQHIHFQGHSHYWIALGYNREFFRRVKA